MTNLFFSVVIPTYNSEEFIKDTLLSVFSQNYYNYEVIVSDDGSNDNTIQKVRSIFKEFPDKKTKLIQNKHIGPGGARNQGIREANGEWISFLDSDDLWFPKKLQKIVDYLLINTKIDLICHSEIWKENDKEILLKYSNSYNPNIHPFVSIYQANAFSTSAITVKKDHLLQVGLFDPLLPSSQDYDLWLRLAMVDKIKIGFIDEPLGYYITREGNISSNIERRLRCKVEISHRYYWFLKKIIKFAFIEKIRFIGIAYTTAGLTQLRQGRNYLIGLKNLIIGLILWPYRRDWMKRILKKMIRGKR